MWTLDYNGTEKSFAAWGIVASLPFEFHSQAKDAVHIITVEGFDDTFQWAFDGKVKIWKDRTAVGSGGTLWFQGWVAEPERTKEGAREHHRYTIYGPWWWLERCQFQQARYGNFGGWIGGDPTAGPILVTVLTSEITLGEDITEAALNTGQQIEALLQWANECFNPTRRGATSGIDASQDLLQIGTIGVAAPIVRYPCRDKKVGELIRDMLRWSQDAICYFDYTTTPPTLNIKTMGALSALSLTVGTDQFKRLRLKPRYDRFIPGVIVRYKKPIQEDSRVWTFWYSDVYPTDLDPYDPDVSVHTIELAGASTTSVKGTITTAPVLAQSGTEADRIAWWKARNPSLKDTSIVSGTLHITSATITDDTGAAVTLSATPNELLKGQVADWMTVGASPMVTKGVTVTANASYQKLKAGTSVNLESVPMQPIIVRLMLTNGSTGTYRTLAHEDAGEDVPGWVGPGYDDFSGGLAQAIYNGFSTLQYEGEPELVGKDINGAIALGKKLTINTPGGTYLNILIQSVAGELTSGTVTPSLGPPNQIGLTDMIEIHRVNRYRIIYNLPSNRSTGEAATTAEVALGEQTPRENTVPGLREIAYHALSFHATTYTPLPGA